MYIMFGSKNIFKQGFTLLEVLIAVGILSIVILTVSIFAFDVFRSELFISENLEAEEQIQQIFKIIAPEIRSMAISNNGSYPLAAVSSSSLSFYSDIDLDGLSERVRYFLEGTVLKKGVIKPAINPVVYDPASEKISETVKNVISNNIFSYYDSNYDGSQPALDYPIDISVIRSVGIKLTVDKNIAMAPIPVVLTTFINIRNLRGK